MKSRREKWRGTSIIEKLFGIGYVEQIVSWNFHGTSEDVINAVHTWEPSLRCQSSRTPCLVKGGAGTWTWVFSGPSCVCPRKRRNPESTDGPNKPPPPLDLFRCRHPERPASANDRRPLTSAPPRPRQKRPSRALSSLSARLAASPRCFLIWC